MNWFHQLLGRSERKSAVGQAPWYLQVAQNGEPPRSYEGQVRLLPIRTLVDAIGRELLILASGAGDAIGGTERTRVFEGLALAPMAPVHLRVERWPDGTVCSRWVARSRDAWGWNANDGTEGAWRWTFQAAGQVYGQPEIVVELASRKLQLSDGDQVALSGSAFGPGTIAVEAVGEGPVGFRTAVAALH